MSGINRRRYADHPEVLEAGEVAYQAVRATWNDERNPTPEEEVAAKNARQQAKIEAAQALIDAE